MHLFLLHLALQLQLLPVIFALADVAQAVNSGLWPVSMPESA
jgi:hypothetical protein